MSPKTTPIEPSASIPKRPDEWARPRRRRSRSKAGAASFESALGHAKKGSRGRRLRPGLQNGACLYSLKPGTGRAIVCSFRFSSAACNVVGVRHCCRASQGPFASTCSAISRATASGFSTFGRWPAPSMISNARAFDQRRGLRTRATGVEPSWSPTRQRVGASIAPA